MKSECESTKLCGDILMFHLMGKEKLNEGKLKRVLVINDVKERFVVNVKGRAIIFIEKLDCAIENGLCN